MIRGTQWRYTSDAVLLVLAAHLYDAGDSIREYEEFLEELERHGGGRYSRIARTGVVSRLGVGLR